MASSTFGRGQDSISASTWSWSVRQSNASAALQGWATPSQTAETSQATALKPAKCFFICRNLLQLRHPGDENVASPNRPVPCLFNPPTTRRWAIYPGCLGEAGVLEFFEEF